MTPVSQSLGPNEAVMMASVARRYYLEGESKVDIGDSLGISRFKVARLLETARSSGMVRIEVLGPPGIDADLSEALRVHLGLDSAVVVPAGSSDPEAREQVAGAAAALLTEVVGDDDVLGLPWSRAVNAMVSELRSLPSVPVVQLSGALVTEGEQSSSVDVVIRAARIAGGRSHVFYAPLILEDAAGAATLRHHPAVRLALERVSLVSIAVVGVGGWRPGASSIYDVVSERTRRAVARSGAVGEIAGVFFDAEGNVLDTVLTERLVTMSGPQLVSIPRVIAMAYGEDKVEAVAGAVRGGLVTSLVTTSSVARGLMSALPSRASTTS